MMNKSNRKEQPDINAMRAVLRPNTTEIYTLQSILVERRTGINADRIPQIWSS